MNHIFNPNKPQFKRNYGFWNEKEQRAIATARVAIAGVGGDGFQLGLTMAMKGVDKFNIADPEVFEPENANRVIGANESTYGFNKAAIFKQKALEINPDADIKIFEEGINSDNVEEFLGDADLVFDESELTYLHIGTSIAREARRQNIPNTMVMNIGFAATVTSFHPKKKHTFEKFMGIPEGMPMDEVKDLSIDLAKCVPYIPSYGDINTLKSVNEGAPLPSIAEGVNIAAGLGASQGFLHIVSGFDNKRPSPIWAPRVGYVDAYNLKSGIIKHPTASHYIRLIGMVLRNGLGLNPMAEYSNDDINRRKH